MANNALKIVYQNTNDIKHKINEHGILLQNEKSDIALLGEIRIRPNFQFKNSQQNHIPHEITLNNRLRRQWQQTCDSATKRAINSKRLTFGQFLRRTTRMNNIPSWNLLLPITSSLTNYTNIFSTNQQNNYLSLAQTAFYTRLTTKPKRSPKLGITVSQNTNTMNWILNFYITH